MSNSTIRKMSEKIVIFFHFIISDYITTQYNRRYDKTRQDKTGHSTSSSNFYCQTNNAIVFVHWFLCDSIWPHSLNLWMVKNIWMCLRKKNWIVSSGIQTNQNSRRQCLRYRSVNMPREKTSNDMLHLNGIWKKNDRIHSFISIFITRCSLFGAWRSYIIISERICRHNNVCCKWNECTCENCNFYSLRTEKKDEREKKFVYLFSFRCHMKRHSKYCHYNMMWIPWQWKTQEIPSLHPSQLHWIAWRVVFVLFVVVNLKWFECHLVQCMEMYVQMFISLKQNE